MLKLFQAVLIATLSLSAAADEAFTPMSAAALADFERPAADARIQYGAGALQFADLRLPPGPGPHPVAVFVHGGCWLAQYDIGHSAKLMAAMAQAGIATWSLEYRRVGDEGGGWPGTFADVGQGADHLRTIAKEYQLDLERVIFTGHSAGGHFALWLAARSSLPKDSPLATAEPLRGRGVLALAPAADLAFLQQEAVCGQVIDGLMGGSPEQFPERYRSADPVQLPLAGVPQRLIIGNYDGNWAPVGMRYFETAKARGDDVRMVEATESGHFEMIDPESTTWPLVLETARELLRGAEQ